MKKTAYRSMKTQYHFNRRKFLKMGSGLGSAVGFGLILGSPPAWPGDPKSQETPDTPKNNLEEVKVRQFQLERCSFSGPP